jgi:hypothetical protein
MRRPVRVLIALAGLAGFAAAMERLDRRHLRDWSGNIRA